MVPKEIIFEEDAREKLSCGIDQIAQVAALTLGPKGRNVGVQAWGVPTITNDGSSAVKEIEIKDQFVDMGVSFGKQVADNIKEKCGDGTTTGIVLLKALVQNGIKNITAGASPISLKRGMEKALTQVLSEIDKMSLPIKSDKDVLNIASVSASGDPEIGKTISNAFKKVGTKGVITIEEGKTTETTIEIVEGMEFDRGYISPYLCTSLEKMLIEMSSPAILVTDQKIHNIHDILNIVQQIAATSRELLIIADDIEGDALSLLVMNKLRGVLKVGAVKAPAFGDRRKAILEDIAILTGANLISEEKGGTLKNADLTSLGSAEKVIISKEKTTIIKGGGSEENIKNRILQIEREIEKATSSYDKEKLQERKAKLQGGVAVIKVGASSEPALKNKKQLFEDSLNSTKSAIEEGIVVGGGIALIKAAKVLKDLNVEGEEQIGVAILKSACSIPCKLIISNAGFDGDVILEDILTSKIKFAGFNVISEKIEDLIESGVVDSVKVVKTALIQAVSIASMVLLTEVLIGDIK